MTDYELEKWIWTEKDFEQMGWHDATVYGLRLTENLELDIDYILQWNQPDIEGFHSTRATKCIINGGITLSL